MNELGIGEALEKLIEALQLEGHEIFRIFTEVQPAIAICNAIIVLFGFIGAIVSVTLINKVGKKRDWFHDWEEGDMIFAYIFVVGISLIVSVALGAIVTDIFLRINYPEYYAAKELISLLVP